MVYLYDTLILNSFKSFLVSETPQLFMHAPMTAFIDP